MDDEQIVDLYFERNEQAIRETDNKYGRLCNRIAFNVLNNFEDAKECVNDTYLGLWNTIPPTRPSNLMAFVCKVARNLSLKRLEYLSRDKRSAVIVSSIDELEDLLPDDRFSPGVGDEEVSALINRFLREQKAENRNIFIRKYFFFDSVTEIAGRYLCSESKVKNVLFNLRKKLKDYLIKEGVAI
jgi:RNA polymerase sigma-70 factor (ECF subfamily)